MGECKAFDCWSFWDLASPSEAARALAEMYGQNAKQAAATNVQTAHRDSRHADREFWLAVLCRTYGIDLDEHFARRSRR